MARWDGSNNARLQVLEVHKNGGTLVESRTTGAITGQLQSVSATANSVVVHDLSYQYGAFGNLATQAVSYDNGSKTTTETYAYDDLHRLVSSSRSFAGVNHSEASLSYSYDAVGNLLSKSDFAASLQYGDIGKGNSGNAGPNAVVAGTRAAGSSLSYSYDNNGNLLSGDGKTLTYNVHNQPLSIATGSSTVSFAYGADLQRYQQVRSSASGTTTTHYVGKLMEIEHSGAEVRTRVYVDDVAIVTFSNVAGDSIRYPLRDRLGSVVSLTDAANLVMEHRSYDPFGKPRHGGMQSAVLARLSSVAGGTPYTNRGFTDHEHLDDAELIHMNGRVYDYNLGRFLSVDPFIQAPGNSQSMNPYSYIMNNPLAGTDPSGYLSECVDEGTNCEETVTPEAGDQIIKDKDGNRYIDKGGDTVTRIDKVSATKNGVTGSVNVRTGEITISAIGSQSHNASNNGEQELTNHSLTANGSLLNKKDDDSVEAEFTVASRESQADGWEDPYEAALAFYKNNEEAYQNTNSESEIVGFLIQDDEGNYHYSNSVTVPATFEMSALIRLPKGWKAMDILHSHPSGTGHQEGFSRIDVNSVKSGMIPGNYVRTPKGDVRFIDKSIANKTKRRWGASGESICSNGTSCMTPHKPQN